MRKLMLTLLLPAVLVVATGCTGIEVLEPAHKLAVENQQNLDHNIQVVMAEFIRIAKTAPGYEESDLAVLEDMARTLTVQVAISTAYLSLIDAMLKGGATAEDYITLLTKIPDLITTGKDLWAEFERVLKEKNQ